MSHKTLIAIVLALFAASALFLFWQNARELDPDQGKNWWTLSFASPKQADNLAFTLENHSDQTVFRYTISADRKTIAEDAFTVQRGETITITPTLTAQVGERTTISVSGSKDKKEIYR